MEHIINETGQLKELLKPKGTCNSSWKKYCIETCYGFWAPSGEYKNINEVRKEKLEIRSPYYGSLFDVIKSSKSIIGEEFEKVATDISKYIKEYKKSEGNDENISWDAEKTVKAWYEWYDLLEKKLESEEFRERIIVGIISASVPNVWSDKISASEFEESFAFNLRYYCKKGQISKNKKAATAFLKKYNIDSLSLASCKRKDLVETINFKIASAMS